MRHKYVLLRDDGKNQVVLREMGEIDREIFALMCEETYPIDALKAPMEKGAAALVRALRTDNIFPLGRYAEKIAAGVIELLTSSEESSLELLFDDVEFLAREAEAEEEEIEIEDTDNGDTLDEMLEDDIGTGYTETNVGVDSPLKIADDEAEDVDAAS